MPAGAVIGAAGSVAGGIASGKGAKKAAKIQQQTAQQQIAALQQMYNTNKALIEPTVHNGEAAQTQQQALLGLGSDPTSALSTLEATPGYAYTVDQALKGVNSNAYASGMGNSGAAEKALQDRAANLATQNYNNYFNQLGTVADRGTSETNALVNQGNLTTQRSNAASQSGADAQSANAVFQGQNLANILKGVSGAAGSAFGSSYGPSSGATSNASITANSPTLTAMNNGSIAAWLKG